VPAHLVERTGRGCRQGGDISQEHQRLAGLGIFEADATQMFGIILAPDNAGERDGLIADDVRDGDLPEPVSVRLCHLVKIGRRIGIEIHPLG
jgi:hypothetical protein